MQNTTPIARVPKDFDPMVISEVVNPLDHDFVHSFDGHPIKIPKGKVLEAPQNVARLMAENIAKAQLRIENEKQIAGMLKKYGEDSKTYQKAVVAAIPEYEKRIEELVGKIMTDRSSIKDVKILDKVKVTGGKGKTEDLPNAPE